MRQTCAFFHPLFELYPFIQVSEAENKVLKITWNPYCKLHQWLNEWYRSGMSSIWPLVVGQISDISGWISDIDGKISDIIGQISDISGQISDIIYWGYTSFENDFTHTANFGWPDKWQHELMSFIRPLMSLIQPLMSLI